MLYQMSPLRGSHPALCGRNRASGTAGSQMKRAAGPSSHREVLEYVRRFSPASDADMLPGLVAFTELWLSRVRDGGIAHGWIACVTIVNELFTFCHHAAGCAASFQRHAGTAHRRPHSLSILTTAG